MDMVWMRDQFLQTDENPEKMIISAPEHLNHHQFITGMTGMHPSFEEMEAHNPMVSFFFYLYN
jgi:hypothetical protein